MGERPRKTQGHRLKRRFQETADPEAHRKGGTPGAMVDCGWGRLIFGHTFEDNQTLADVLRAEGPDRRDIAFYVPEPQVLLSMAPAELFLDPSVTYRLDFTTYHPARQRRQGFSIRRLSTRADAEAVNRIYAENNMVQIAPEFFWRNRDVRLLSVLVAEDSETGEILGTVMGVDHKLAFNDPEHGSSLWCLSVSQQAPHSGIGESMVRRLAEQFQTRGASYMDLSVLHDNAGAIALYEKLGFRRVPIYAVKRKNQINEKLFTDRTEDSGLNPYAGIIVAEARRRGIGVHVIDVGSGLFSLSYGGRSVRCRESLSEFTSAVAMSICDDKALTYRTVAPAGVQVPAQMDAADRDGWQSFLDQHGQVVVKPARGEQGNGVAVGLSTVEEIEAAVDVAGTYCSEVLIEQYFEGQDLRLVVIDYKVVAAAIRRPATIIGDGMSSVSDLIEKQSRRRMAATGGESRIPMDGETERCVRAAGLTMADVPERGREIQVRKAANLHTGGTIIDVTGEAHPALINAAITAARAIEIPVTGIDLVVKSPRLPDHVFIEANERPGLANHEPQPTAERFVDFLFPLSLPAAVREATRRPQS